MHDTLYAQATAGIYAEIVNQIYDSLDKRIREAVSNAYDARATEVKISIFIGRENKIIIFDNGDGMDDVDIREKYLSMGGGDNYNNEETIGRIGIGALSVFALGDKIMIRTRKKDTDSIVTAELDLDKVKDSAQHAVPLDRVQLGRITSIKKAKKEDDAKFTEIVITNISKTALEIFQDADKTEDLIKKLERILPVEYRNNDPIFDKLSTDLKDKLKNEIYKIKVIFHMPDMNYNNYKIYRRSIYTSEEDVNIVSIRPLFPIQLEGGFHKDLTVFGYFYLNSDKALPKEWRGINARVKNVTIENDTYFGVEQDAAARVRIGGEIYIEHLDENHAIQTNRSGFALENNDYLIIEKYLQDYILGCIDIVRKNTEINSAVKRIVLKLAGIRGIFENISDNENGKPDASSFKMLDDSEVEIADFNTYSLENHLKIDLDKLEVQFELIWNKLLEDYFFIKQEDDDYYSVQVHDDLREFIFNVSGNSIQFYLGYLGSDMPLVIKKTGKIIANLDNELIPNKDITKIDNGFLHVVLVMYLNLLRSNNDAKILFNNTISDLA